MKFLAAASKFAFVGSQVASRNPSLQPVSMVRSYGYPTTLTSRTQQAPSTRQFFSGFFSSKSENDESPVRKINKEELKEILEDYENGGRRGSGYVVLDVREPDEVTATGSLSPNTYNLPFLSVLAEQDLFAMDADEFEKISGIPKPALDEKLVFSCASGVRSTKASALAATNGYTQIINYTGGAKEWFG